MDTRTRDRKSFELMNSDFRNTAEHCIASFEMEHDDGVHQSHVDEMSRPVSLEKAYAIFGLLLGIVPMLSVPARVSIAYEIQDISRNLGFWSIWFLASIATGFFGYLLGGRAARWEKRIASFRLSWYLTLLPVVGLAWGAASGALGGLFLFLIGAIFGASFGGVIGLFAVTPFAVVMRLLSVDEHIESKHLFPLAVGVPMVVAALWLGS